MRIAAWCGVRVTGATSCLGIAFLLSSCGGMEIVPPAGLAHPNSILYAAEPEGQGPFPAVVLLHTCGGVQLHISQWGERLVRKGYVAVVMDSFGSRGAGYICGTFEVTVDQVAADALLALDHLRAKPSVDKERIAVAGFSYGAMAALRLASPGYRKFTQGRPGGFRAAAAFYPMCTDLAYPGVPPQVKERLNNLYPDVDTPALILIGDADDETPAYQCEGPARQIARQGRPVSLKVYPGATHNFDSDMFGTAGSRTSQGFFYRYSPEATEDAARVLFEHFEKHMPPAKPTGR